MVEARTIRLLGAVSMRKYFAVRVSKGYLLKIISHIHLTAAELLRSNLFLTTV